MFFVTSPVFGGKSFRDNNYFKNNMQHCTCNRRQISVQRSEPSLASHPDYYKTRSLDRSSINRSRDRRRRFRENREDRSRSCSQISVNHDEPFSRNSLAYSSLPPVVTP